MGEASRSKGLSPERSTTKEIQRKIHSAAHATAWRLIGRNRDSKSKHWHDGVAAETRIRASARSCLQGGEHLLTVRPTTSTLRNVRIRLAGLSGQSNTRPREYVVTVG